MHAFFADGVDKMHISWAVEGLPTLLHLSLFLFFGGLVIFLFNVDQEVFRCVVWWIGLFTLVYGLITLLPFIRHNSPYYGPLSILTWFLYSSIPYVTFTVLSFIAYSCGYDQTWIRYDKLRDGHRARMLGGVEKAAEEVASKRSSEIDGRILGWTVRALGDDDSLEKFFEAILGFFDSKLVKNLERNLPETHLKTFWGAMDGFMSRTFSSNSVTESVKSRRVLICRDIMGMIPCPYGYMCDNFRCLPSHFDQAPVTIERLRAMKRWFTHPSSAVSDGAKFRVAMNLLRMQERDDRWTALASNVYGMAVPDIEDNVALGGDNLLLAILIHVSRQAIIDSYREGLEALVQALTQLDIRHTIPGLQHDFCTLWNELVKEARDFQHYEILRSIRHLYITLHRGTDAAPTAFSASTDSLDTILDVRSSYPLCNIATHRPDSTAPVPLLTQPAHSPDVSSHHSTSGGSTASQQVKEASNVARPSSPDPMTFSEIGDSSRARVVTSPALPVNTNPRPTDALPPGAVAIALQNIPPAAPFSCPLEGIAQQDILVPYAEADISESTMSAPAPTPSLTPVSASTQHVLNTALTSCDAGVASASDPLIPALSVVSFPTPCSPPPPRVPPFPKTRPRPTDNTTPPRLRARGFVNFGNMCFANAVLHLLVHTPLFWNLFRELGGLKGQREAGGSETGGGATPLVDATIRFSEEFVFKDKEPPQQVAGGKPREDEEAKKEHNSVDSFEPTYMYDAMKEKRQLKRLLVRSRSQDALLCY